MPSGTNNAPGVYSDMVKNFNEKWDILFIVTLRKIETLLNKQVTVTKTDELFIGDNNIIP